MPKSLALRHFGRAGGQRRKLGELGQQKTRPISAGLLATGFASGKGRVPLALPVRIGATFELAKHWQSQ